MVRTAPPLGAESWLEEGTGRGGADGRWLAPCSSPASKPGPASHTLMCQPSKAGCPRGPHGPCFVPPSRCLVPSTPTPAGSTKAASATVLTWKVFDVHLLIRLH